MNSTEEAKKSINELKIAELRRELEQRGVDHKGLKLKQNLIEALENVLKEEGNDPAEFLFTVSDKTASSKKKPGGSVTKSEKEDSKADHSTFDSSGLVESAEATTTTTEPSDDKSTDEVREENSSKEESTRLAEGEVNSSKADDSSNMEALQLTEPDDLYDEYRETTSELSAEVKKADEKAHAETGGSSSSKKKSSSSSSTSAAKKHSSSTSSSSNNNTTNTSNSNNKARGKRREEEKANGSVKSAAATTGDQGDSTFDAEEAHIGHSDGNSVEVKSRSKEAEKQKSTSSKSSADDKEKSKKKDLPPPPPPATKEKDSAKSDPSKKETKDTTKEKSDGKASSSSAPKAKASGKSSADANGAANNEGRNVWVSGITASTRASDLQAICKKYGKVVGVKIIANSKQPGSKCYGVVTLDSKEEAEVAVKNLNKTELNGKTIIVEKVMPPEAATLLKQSHEATSKEKERAKEKESNTKTKRDDFRDKPREKKRSRDRSPVRRRGRSRSPIGRNIPPRGPPRGPPARQFAPPPPPRRPNPAELRRIEAERVAMRRERIMRDAERRRMEDERRTRDEFEREKEKLRLERERLERERAELLRLEREKARIERERIEREKEELKRRLQQPHPDDLRRGSSSLSSVTSLKRPYDARDTVYYDTVKRSMLSESPITAPPTMSSYASDARYSMSHYGTSSLVRATTSDARYSDYSDVRRDVPRERDDRKTPVSSNTGSGVSASSSYYRPDPSRSLATGRTGPSARGDDSWRRDAPSTGPGVRPTSGGVNPLMPVASPVSTMYSSMPLSSGVMPHPPLGSSSGHQLTSHPSDRFVAASMRRF